MLRRFWLQGIAASLVALCGIRTHAQQGSINNLAERSSGLNTVSLEDQLQNGLRAVTPSQRAYVKLIVANVKLGRIPQSMVNLVYRWALEKNSSVPFPYFKYAMDSLSRRRGVNLNLPA